MKKIALAVHGGASSEYPHLKQHQKEVEDGLAEATTLGYQVLEQGGSAVDAVEVAVKSLEDNPLFNAGRGSALNCQGEVEMDASIMDGQTMDAGAVSIIRQVRNPISLARLVMVKTHHVFLSGQGALDLARNEGLSLEPESYFITGEQYQDFLETRQKESKEAILNKKMKGTVGAVALDKQGNLASATSTGGTSNCLPGRIGDSCIIGAGCYANNKSCAVSGTGEGEYLITGVIAHTIACFVEQGMGMQEACDYVLHIRNKQVKNDMGVISVNAQGEFGMAFNTGMMKRAYVSSDLPLRVEVF